MASILKVDTIQDQSGNNIINENADTITIGASGDTVNIIGTLQNNGAGVGGTNTPAFEAYLSSDQTVSDNANTKAQFDTEVFDTDGCYDNSTNYRFTPTVAGKYYVYAGISAETANSSYLVHNNIEIQKNGSQYKFIQNDFRDNYAFITTSQVDAIIDMNGTSDYLEIFAAMDVVSGTAKFDSSTKNTYFGAYKIIE